MKKKVEEAEVDIVEVQRGRVAFAVIGESPLIMNRMSEKAKHELLLPKGRKTAGDKVNSLKHDVMAEFAASPYTLEDEAEKTLLALPATAFKGAIRSAALDIPGARKAQIGRLTYIDAEYVGIYGIPYLKMDVTRSADMNKTPDIRTRVAVKKWAAVFSVLYVKPILNEKSIGNLLAAAGMSVGVGDWRVEKGSGAFGRFRPTSSDDADFLDIISHGGRKQQKNAMADPEPYDAHSAELLGWFSETVVERGKAGMLAKGGR